jgi:hypothetical protein
MKWRQGTWGERLAADKRFLAFVETLPPTEQNKARLVAARQAVDRYEIERKAVAKLRVSNPLSPKRR